MSEHVSKYKAQLKKDLKALHKWVITAPKMVSGEPSYKEFTSKVSELFLTFVKNVIAVNGHFPYVMHSIHHVDKLDMMYAYVEEKLPSTYLEGFRRFSLAQAHKRHDQQQLLWGQI